MTKTVYISNLLNAISKAAGVQYYFADYPEGNAKNRRNDSDPTGTIGRSYPMAQWILPVTTEEATRSNTERYNIQLLLSVPTNTNDTGTQQTQTSHIESLARLGAIAVQITNALRSLKRAGVPAWIVGSVNQQSFTQRDADALDQVLMTFTLLISANCRILTAEEIADLVVTADVSQTDDLEVV